MNEENSKSGPLVKMMKPEDLDNSGMRKIKDDDYCRIVNGFRKYKKIMTPVIIRRKEGSEKPEVVTGHLRTGLSTQADIAEIPCIEVKMDDVEAAYWCMSENLDRVNPNPIDEAEGFKKLMDLGQTQEQIIHRLNLGKGQPYLSETVSLLKLPESVQKFVRYGQISRSIAEKIGAIKDPKDQEEIAKLAAKEQWTVKQFEDHFTKENKSHNFHRRTSHEPPSACSELTKCSVLHLFEQILQERKSKQQTLECNQCSDQKRCKRIVFQEMVQNETSTQNITHAITSENENKAEVKTTESTQAIKEPENAEVSEVKTDSTQEAQDVKPTVETFQSETTQVKVEAIQRETKAESVPYSDVTIPAEQNQHEIEKWSRGESNPRPPECDSGALPN